MFFFIQQTAFELQITTTILTITVTNDTKLNLPDYKTDN